MKRLIILASASFALAGCQHALDFTPTMASDPPIFGGEASVLQTELLAALEAVPNSNDSAAQFELCKRLRPAYQDAQRLRRQRGNADEQYRDTNGPFGCYRFRTIADESKRKEAALRHLLSGFALTDYYCDVFFERIAERSAKRRFARSGVNDVGAAMSAILGLAAAGSGLTGGVGAGFGLMDSTIRNYDEAFLVYSDLPAMQELVRSEQQKFRDGILKPDNAAGLPSSFQESSIQIMRYANMCSFTGMRGLMNESMVEKAAAAANPLDGSRITDFMSMTLDQRRAYLRTLDAYSDWEEAGRPAPEAAQTTPQDDNTQSPPP
jgi:hypothetical protein